MRVTAFVEFTHIEYSKVEGEIVSSAAIRRLSFKIWIVDQLGLNNNKLLLHSP
jgi:hypothetical protein